MRKPEEHGAIFDILRDVIVVGAVVLAPLPLGSVSPWAAQTLHGLAVVALGLWLLGAARRGRLELVRSPVWLAGLAFLGLIAVQLVPLAPGTVESLSPAAHETYRRTLDNYPESGEARTLSLNPYATRVELVRLLSLVAFFVVTVHGRAGRVRLIALSAGVLFVALFEALYGLSAQLASVKKIFWLERKYHLYAVTGTFHNKNHFAGLLEMALPLCLALMFAIGMTRRPSRRGSGSTPLKIRVATLLSSSTMYYQVALALVGALLALALMLSLSRAAILCTICVLTLLILFIGSALQLRRYTLLMLLVVSIVIAAGSGIGMEVVADAIEDASSGEATSWLDRRDLTLSGLSYAREYLWLGSGLGTFSSVFPRFQSARFGERVARALHNDWLQLVDEVGVLGGLVAAASCAWVLIGIFRGLRRQSDAFRRWLATGALLGAVAMLGHSLADYNLSLVTSNGLIFAIVLAIAHLAAHHPSRGSDDDGRWRVRLPLPIGIGLTVVVIATVGWRISAARAMVDGDLAFNRFASITSVPEDYFFLRVAADGPSREESLALAAQYTPDDPRIPLSRGRLSLLEREEMVVGAARETAKQLIGAENEGSEPFEAALKALTDSLRLQMQSETAPFLVRAASEFQHGIVAAPSRFYGHRALAATLMSLEPGSARHLRALDAALWLAPNNPATLSAAGTQLLSLHHAQEPIPGLPEMAVVRDVFQRAIYAAPRYAGIIYGVVRSQTRSTAMLLDVTPPTVGAQEQLYSDLLKANDWPRALECLDRIEAASASRDKERANLQRGADFRSDVDAHVRGATGYDLRSADEIRLSVAVRRVKLLGAVGRWDDRRERVKDLRRLVRSGAAADLAIARDLSGRGLDREAADRYRELLRRDWGNPEVSIELARLATLPSVVESIAPGEHALDTLLRLVINSESLPVDVARRIDLQVANLSSPNARQARLGEVVRGAAKLLAEQREEAVATLEGVLPNVAELREHAHLPWLYLGRAYQSQGRLNAALEAYRRVEELVPTHLSALEQLVELETDPIRRAHYAERLADITPPIRCDVDFGGRVTLVGYSLEEGPQGDGPGQPRAQFMSYYWRTDAQLPPTYSPAIHFIDKPGNILFQTDHRLRRSDGTPLETTRSGELLVVRIQLPRDPATAALWRVGMFTPSPAHGWPDWLASDMTETLVYLALPSDPPTPETVDSQRMNAAPRAGLGTSD